MAASLRITLGFRRLLSTSTVLARKKDLLAHEKLTVCDFGEVDTARKLFYVFGSTTEGALGLAGLLKPGQTFNAVYEFLHHPVRNSFGGTREVLDIEAGHGFTLIRAKGNNNRTEEATIFGTGLNTHSQLGYHAVRVGAPLGLLIRPVPLSSLPKSTGSILAMGCGRAHSVLSLHGGGLLTFGDNSNGQCGRFPIPDEEYFGSRFSHWIPSFGSTPEEDVISIVSKFDVTFCLTRSGKVYSFGTNHKGQLGRGARIVKTWEPGVVGGDLAGETVVKISTSGNSVLAVTQSGSLFGWGCNELGQVDSRDSGQIYYEPRGVSLEHRIGKVKDAAMGEQSSHIVNEKGEVWTWGLGECLGIGPRVVRVRKPTLMPPPLFGRNDLCPDLVVDKVFAGFFHVAAVNSRGDLYTWGKNTSGCLGLGLKRDDEQLFPLRVSLAGFVEKVAIGVDHTVVLCRGGI